MIAGISLIMFAGRKRCRCTLAWHRQPNPMDLPDHQADVRGVNMRGSRHALSADTELKFLALQ